MPRDIKFLMLALRYSYQSPHERQFAAIIVRGNRIFSIGYNQYRSHPKQETLYHKKHQLHAEVAAIIGLRLDLIQGATMYVVRHLANGNMAIAKPCLCCEQIIRSVGISKVAYSITGNSKQDNFEYGTMKL